LVRSNQFFQSSPNVNLQVLLQQDFSRGSDDDDDDDEGRINFSVALSPKTTRTRNNKPKQ